MERFVKIDNIFNYIPSPIRKMQADDDQLKSWAMQGLDKLNLYPRYIKDIVFIDVQNHNAVLPDGFKRMISVKVFNPEVELTEEEDDLVDTIHYEAFVNSDFYRLSWTTVKHVGYLDKDYLRCIENGSCSHAYSTKPGSNILTFSFLEGPIAIEYEKNMTDDEDNFLVPEEPIVLWEYLSSYVQMRHWSDRLAMSEQGALQMYRMKQQETAAYLESARGAINRKNVKPNIHRELIYGESRMLKIPSFIHRHFSHRYL